MKTPRTQALWALALLPCLLLGSGCRALRSLDFESDVDLICVFGGYATLSDARVSDTGTGWIEGLCSSSECGEEHPLAVGAQGSFELYFEGSVDAGELTSSDPDVIRVQQLEVEEGCVDGEPGARVAGTFEVVGPGTASLGWTADGSEKAGVTLHAARAERLEISFKTYLLDGIEIDWDEESETGTFTPEEERIPSLQKVEGGVVARVGRGFRVKLAAHDADDRRLVLAGGPTSEATFFESELETDPKGLLSFDPPHGGANIIYEVDIDKAGDGTLVGTLPALGLSTSRTLRALDPEDYDAWLAAP